MSWTGSNSVFEDCVQGLRQTPAPLYRPLLLPLVPGNRKILRLPPGVNTSSGNEQNIRSIKQNRNGGKKKKITQSRKIPGTRQDFRPMRRVSRTRGQCVGNRQRGGHRVVYASAAKPLTYVGKRNHANKYTALRGQENYISHT